MAALAHDGNNKKIRLSANATATNAAVALTFKTNVGTVASRTNATTLVLAANAAQVIANGSTVEFTHSDFVTTQAVARQEKIQVANVAANSDYVIDVGSLKGAVTVNSGNDDKTSIKS